MTTIPPNPEEALVTISTPKSDTIRVRDRVESSRFEFYFDGEVDIAPTSTDELYFPVDVAGVVGDTGEITIPFSTGVIFHDHHSGAIVERFITGEERTELPHGEYDLEIISAPMKVYIHITSSIDISRDVDRVILSLNPATDAVIGVRSHHEQPAGTITTTGEIESVMAAVSHFGSALKTTSVERSWPTLRGYPPRVAVGDELSVPRTIDRPKTGVRLKLPRTLDAVFKTAPLAYYLAAEVTPQEDPGEPAELVADGNKIPLDGDLTEAATRLLQNNLLLDSIVRTEGLYSFEIKERKEIEKDLPWDPKDIYDLSLPERISKYQEVPEGTLDKIRPVWPLTADVAPSNGSLPSLPHLAEELAKVRVPEYDEAQPSPAPSFIGDFIRADGSGVRSEHHTSESAENKPKVASPDPWDTQMHISLLDEYPIGSNRTSTRAYERHINRTDPEKSAIEVHVVCNDDEMREEEVVTDLYGVRDLLEFDVKIHHKLSTDELRALLDHSFDLIHYIGHVDEQGILCSDGYLDVRTDVDSVNVDAFLLNACSSIEQGEALLELGAISGIATLFDVPNSSATRLGRSLSRLLNRGFSIRGALEIARESSILGQRWVSMGDGRVSLTQTEGAFPSVLNVTPDSGNTFDLELEWFETSAHRIGSLVVPATSWGNYQVMPSRTHKNVTAEQLSELFALEVSPIRCNNDLYWTDEVSPEDLLLKSIY